MYLIYCYYYFYMFDFLYYNTLHFFKTSIVNAVSFTIFSLVYYTSYILCIFYFANRSSRALNRFLNIFNFPCRDAITVFLLCRCPSHRKPSVFIPTHRKAQPVSNREVIRIRERERERGGKTMLSRFTLSATTRASSQNGGRVMQMSSSTTASHTVHREYARTRDPDRDAPLCTPGDWFIPIIKLLRLVDFFPESRNCFAREFITFLKFIKNITFAFIITIMYCLLYNILLLLLRL